MCHVRSTADSKTFEKDVKTSWESSYVSAGDNPLPGGEFVECPFRNPNIPKHSNTFENIRDGRKNVGETSWQSSCVSTGETSPGDCPPFRNPIKSRTIENILEQSRRTWKVNLVGVFLRVRRRQPSRRSFLWRLPPLSQQRPADSCESKSAAVPRRASG